MSLVELQEFDSIRGQVPIGLQKCKEPPRANPTPTSSDSPSLPPSTLPDPMSKKRQRPEGGLSRAAKYLTMPSSILSKLRPIAGHLRNETAATVPASLFSSKGVGHVDVLVELDSMAALNEHEHIYPPVSDASMPSPAPIRKPPPTPERTSSLARKFRPDELKREQNPIAKGNFGTVYLGRASSLSQVVVIKDMLAADQRAVESWQKEVDLMASCRSPHVARIFGSCRDDANKTLSIVMEYCPGGDLFALLHKKKEGGSLSNRARMAIDIAKGLEVLHQRSILHRDVKSLNILIGENMQAKLTDFGLSKRCHPDSFLMTAKTGTPLWMAPEVRDSGNYNEKADIWSLGLVCFELFSGQLPQWDSHAQAAVLPSDFPHAHLVHWMMEVNPERRPTAAQVVRALELIV